MVKRYVPSRGDLVWLNFTPQAGHEQAGHRPALVLSPAPYNDKAGLMLCCPITSQAKGYPFEVLLSPDAPVRGAVLSDQLRSVDWRARKAKPAGVAGDDVVGHVLARARAGARPSARIAPKGAPTTHCSGTAPIGSRHSPVGAALAAIFLESRSRRSGDRHRAGGARRSTAPTGRPIR